MRNVARDAPSRTERAALCDLLLEVGPDAPTLCEGWTTLDLTAHLLVRERKPTAGPGIVLGGPLGKITERAMARVSAGASFEELVARLRAGPPFWWWAADRFVNTIEFFVHHEDVRRGGGDIAPRPERGISNVESSLWQLTPRIAPLLTRSLGPTGLELSSPGHGTVRARRGSPSAVVTGRPGEIVLYLYGRKDAASVGIGGPPEAVEALRSARFGL